MGLFNKHNPEIRERFIEIFNQGSHETESEFLDQINEVVRMIELDKDYSTNQKLMIYELLSQICNCSPSDRVKFARRLKRKL